MTAKQIKINLKDPQMRQLKNIPDSLTDNLKSRDASASKNPNENGNDEVDSSNNKRSRNVGESR